MNNIKLENVLPHVFQNEKVESDIWQKDIHFSVGNHYLIESASGKGKSSLCSYVFGYRSDYSGSISFDRMEAKKVLLQDWDKIRSAEISLLFQELRLFTELTVMENIQIKNNITGYKSPDQIRDMLQQLNIEHKKDVKIGKMSWGQQQRVAIIRALCQPFNFLILDEPISHLDDENSKLIAELVTNEAYTQGAGVIVTSIGKNLPITYNQTFAL